MNNSKYENNISATSGLVTAIIPGYKNKYILETIESIRRQSYENIEIIVIDDGSPNNLARTLAKLIDAGTIRYIYQDNQKMAAARNNGIKHAKGEFIAFIDDDDLWGRDKIKKQLNCFVNSDVGLVYTFAEGFNGADAVRIKNFELAYSGRIFCDIFLQDFIANSSVMIRKSCFDSVGVFNTSPDYFGVDDCDMWTRITSEFDAAVVPEKLTRIRLHSEQFSKNSGVMRKNDMHVRSRLMDALDVPTYYKRRYYQRAYFDAAYGLRRSNKAKAFKFYLQSLYSLPSLKSVLGILKLPLN